MAVPVAILFGGEGSERRVSVASAQNVASILDGASLWFWRPDGSLCLAGRSELLGFERPFERDFSPSCTRAWPALESALDSAEAQGADAARVVSNNSRRRPSTLNFDLRLFKNFYLDPLNLSLFVKVFNLFDRRNEVTVYGETGRATASTASLGIGEVAGDRLNPVSSYIVRPDYYSEPREIQVGFEINF